MADVIGTLNARRIKLCSLKKSILDDANRQVKEIDAQIADLDKAKEVINKAIEPYLCKYCKGTGTIRVPDAAGQMDDEPCGACNGTGIKTE